MSDGQPELVDNEAKYGHADALRWLAKQYPRPLRVATGYVRLGGLQALGELPLPDGHPIQLLLGAMPEPGLGEDSVLIDEARQAGLLLERALKRLREERDFDAFPPSRRLKALQAVDAFLANDSVRVRRFVHRFLHGKAYIFAEDPGTQGGPGAALVTSANLTTGGLAANLELGLVHYQPNVVRDAVDWFDDLWDRSDDFKDQLRDLLFPELPEFTPQTIFLRMLLELYGDELEAVAAPAERPTLARFQQDGYARALYILERQHGVIYADGVGTGKTHVGLEFIRRFAGEHGYYTLVIAPAQLRDSTWEKALHRANLPGEVVSYQELAMDEQLAPPRNGGRRRVLAVNKDAYRLVIVDEAHAFRNADTTYYYALDRLLGGTQKSLVLLTATPVNNALWDIYNQIMLFARHDAAFAGELGIRDLRQFFREAGANDPDLISPAKIFPLIDAVAVRRDRKFLEKHYSGDTFPDGTPVRFPKPLFREHRYDLDAAYPGVFKRIVKTIGDLKMARYQPRHYLRDKPVIDAREIVLAGLIQSGLLKRFESSVHSAHQTVTRMLSHHSALIFACKEHGQVPSLSSLKALVEELNDGAASTEAVLDLLNADEDAVPADAFSDVFLEDLEADEQALQAMHDDLQALMQQDDPKLHELARLLKNTPAQKVAVFTSFTDTARYLRERMEQDQQLRAMRSFVSVVGDELSPEERQRRLERFCPRSMTEDDSYQPPDGEVDLLLATDVISEGQNLQDAQAVVSYDMPWNPQRVVQRNGRIIRLKSRHREVYLHTLLAKKGDLDDALELEARLRQKIAAANASIGMESKVLAALEAESRAYAELKEFTDRLAEGDVTLLEEGEGSESGSFAGEEYRAKLARAQMEGEIPRLNALPWGIGSCFRQPAGGETVHPVVMFAARDRRGGRHWRAIGADGQLQRDDLEMLKLSDPGDAPRADIPGDLDLDGLWSVAVRDICDEHNAALDPAFREQRLPASQRWALGLLRDPSLPERPELGQADAALLAPRDAVVLRALSTARRQLDGGEITPLQAVDAVLTVIAEFGLRPVSREHEIAQPLMPDDVGVVVYQVVL